jgi:hypothetical protein
MRSVANAAFVLAHVNGYLTADLFNFLLTSKSS